MINTPYNELRQLAGRPETWKPVWATGLEVHRRGNTTTYIAQPEHLDAEALTDLQHLAGIGWDVRIDGPRLSRLRISLTKITEEVSS